MGRIKGSRKWSHADHLNLAGAYLHNFKLENIHVSSINLTRARFVGDFYFGHSTVDGSADFADSVFEGTVQVEFVSRIRELSFDRSVFAKRVYFNELNMKQGHLIFEHVECEAGVLFMQVRSGLTSLFDCKFAERVEFMQCIGNSIWIGLCTFDGGVKFQKTEWQAIGGGR